MACEKSNYDNSKLAVTYTKLSYRFRYSGNNRAFLVHIPSQMLKKVSFVIQQSCPTLSQELPFYQIIDFGWILGA